MGKTVGMCAVGTVGKIVAVGLGSGAQWVRLVVVLGGSGAQWVRRWRWEWEVGGAVGKTVGIGGGGRGAQWLRQ